MRKTGKIGSLICLAAATTTCALSISAEGVGERLLKELKSAGERVCTTRPERLASPAAATATGSTRLRDGPGTACRGTARVRQGDRLRVLGSHAGWYYVVGTDSKGRQLKGWVERRKLALANPTAQSGEAPNAQHAGGGQSRATASGDPTADKATVRRVQAALKRRGYEVGTADGIYGRNTRRALQSFQRDNGLPPSGRIDARTLGALDTAPRTAHPRATASAGSPVVREHCTGLRRLQLPPATAAPPCPFVYAADYVMECFLLPMQGQPVKASPLYDAPESDRVVGTLEPGEKFTAVARKDFVVPCPLRVKRATRAYAEKGPRGATQDVMLSPGEVVYQISYLGEGTAAYWRNGQIVKGDNTGLTRAACQRWDCWADPLIDCQEDALQRMAKERWFHVRTRDGRSGWIRDSEHLDWDEKC